MTFYQVTQAKEKNIYFFQSNIINDFKFLMSQVTFSPILGISVLSLIDLQP